RSRWRHSTKPTAWDTRKSGSDVLYQSEVLRSGRGTHQAVQDYRTVQYRHPCRLAQRDESSGLRQRHNGSQYRFAYLWPFHRYQRQYKQQPYYRARRATQLVMRGFIMQIRLPLLVVMSLAVYSQTPAKRPLQHRDYDSWRA